MNNVILSFTYMYGDFQSPCSVMLDNLFRKKSTDVSSYAAKIERSQSKRVQTIMDAFEEMKNK